jgi:hypothetical protein
MYSDLPIAVEIDVSPDRIREDLLGQLYWNVFGLQGDIAVRDGDTLIPLANHAISSESIADPPVSKITVRIQVCEEKHSMDETDEEEYRYQPPTPILIEKQGGTPILLNKFIDHVHPFLNANKDEVFKCVDEIYTQPTELGDGTKFDGVDPAEFEGVDQDEDEPTAPSLFTRSGNIQQVPDSSLTRPHSTSLTRMNLRSTSTCLLKATWECHSINFGGTELEHKQ